MVGEGEESGEKKEKKRSFGGVEEAKGVGGRKWEG